MMVSVTLTISNGIGHSDGGFQEQVTLAIGRGGGVQGGFTLYLGTGLGNFSP